MAMKIVKNMGIDIPAAIEDRDRRDCPPCARKDNFAAQAKKDFAYYSKPAVRRHPNYR